MLNRHRIFIGLTASAGICTGIGLFLFYRYRRGLGLSKSPRPGSPTAFLSSLKPHHDYAHSARNSSSEIDTDETESFHFSDELQIPDGGVPLTPDQAAILIRFLCESVGNEEQLHHALTSIANASTFRESQINLANAGCITHLRELLFSSTTETTNCKLLLALNNLALNEFAIRQFSNIVSLVIELCSKSAPRSPVRSYGLTLLINMSVLDYLHDEYMTHIYELGSLIASTFAYDDEALSAGKLLVNLSKNRSNLEKLLRITGLELKTIVNFFASKSEGILLRYLTFYHNLAEMIIVESRQGGDSNNNSSYFHDPKPQRQGALYFEFFDQDKLTLAKSLLRPHHESSTINNQMKRLYQAMERIRQTQITHGFNQKEA